MSNPFHNPALQPPGVGPVQGPANGQPASRPTPAPQGPSFAEVLAGKTTGALQFSKHALQRVERRGLELSGATLARLEAGVARAAGKGSRDSVVFVDDTAFVVSVRNRTVVTAVDAAHMREQIFTNIDSAVIA